MTEISGLPSATVAVCTYNRCQSLTRTLESLCALHVPDGLRWEVLVIDNNSPDATRQTAEAFTARLPLRYVFEPVQGLSHARNRAVRESKFDLIVFTDDDVLLDDNWLSAFVEAAERYPGVGFFGGKVFPYWPDSQPAWYREESLKALGGLLVSYSLDGEDRRLASEDPPPIGASFGFRRELLLQLGAFRVDLGTCGAKRGAGEDTEMVQRARHRGAEGVYVGSAVCRHFVEKQRTTLRHAFEYGVRRGIHDAVMARDCEASGSYCRAVACCVRAVYQMLKGRGDRVRLCLRNAGMELGRCRALRRGAGVPANRY